MTSDLAYLAINFRRGNQGRMGQVIIAHGHFRAPWKSESGVSTSPILGICFTSLSSTCWSVMFDVDTDQALHCSPTRRYFSSSWRVYLVVWIWTLCERGQRPRACFQMSSASQSQMIQKAGYYFRFIYFLLDYHHHLQPTRISWNPQWIIMEHPPCSGNPILHQPEFHRIPRELRCASMPWTLPSWICHPWFGIIHAMNSMSFPAGSWWISRPAIFCLTMFDQKAVSSWSTQSSTSKSASAQWTIMSFYTRNTHMYIYI